MRILESTLFPPYIQPFGWNIEEWKGEIYMFVTVRIGGNNVIITYMFYVIDTLSDFNIILEKKWLHMMHADPPTYYQVNEFSNSNGIMPLWTMWEAVLLGF